MGFLEDIPKGGFSTVLIGVGAAIVAPAIIPAIGAALRPIAVALVKGGVMMYDAAKETVAEAGEQVNDMVAEARTEIADETNGASDETAGGRSTSSRRRRRS